jgi:hypothetical protein
VTDLEITRGDDETLAILVTDPDAEPANDPLDLTGAALTFMVKRRPTDDDDDALLTKVTPTEIAIDPDQTTNTGQATIAITPDDTGDLASGNYYWELESLLGGDVKTLASGRIRIAADLIRG